MLAKINGFAKKIFYQLRYGKRIMFYGIPWMEKNAKVKMIEGDAEFGYGFSMKPGAYCAIVNEGRLYVGNNVSIGRDSVIVCHEKVEIGNNCAIAPHVLIYDHDHKFGIAGIEPGYNTASVIIEKNCWIGAGTIILRGTHIGEGSVIGAGCVVQGNIPAHSMVTSNRQLNIVPIVERRGSLNEN